MNLSEEVFVIAACLIAMSAAYALLLRLLRAFVLFVNEAMDISVALLFYVLIVPPLWLWEKGKRPMWRTLSKEQSQQLQVWLRRQS